MTERHRMTEDQCFSALRIVGTAGLRASALSDEHFSKFFDKVFPGKPLSVRAEYVNFAMDWCGDGCPQIIVADKLFASLAATNIPSDLIPDIGTPWSTFIVRIPAPFRVGLAPDGSPIDYLYYHANGFGPPTWAERCPAFGACSAHVITGLFRQPVRKLSDLLSEHSGCGMELPVSREGDGATVQFVRGGYDDRGDASEARTEDVQGAESTHYDGTAMDIYGRAMAGIIIEMMAPNMRERARAAAKRGLRHKRGAPRSWTFQLTRNVAVDVRDKVIESLRAAAGGRRVRMKPSVQVLVRGHWKRQPFGSGRQERRFIHVEPYWRGPEEVPIAMRSHVLKKDDDEDTN